MRFLATFGTAMILAACTTKIESPSYGDTPAPPGPGQPVAATEIDALTVPIEQVTINGQPWDTLHGDGVATQPRPDQSDPDCRLPEIGSETLAFREVRYSDVGNTYVLQRIGIYSDRAKATEGFQPVLDAVNSCENPDRMIDSATSESAAWHEKGFSAVSGPDAMLYATTARAVKNVVFEVTVGHREDGPQIATSVADQITANVNQVV